MSKARKNKEKILNKLLIVVMMVSLLAGILTIEVKAASNTHTHSGYTAINSSNFSSLLENIKDGGNFYLTENITISSRIDITSGTVNLCLNGKKISASSSYNTSLFYVENATLNIFDCAGGGILTGGKGYLNGTQKGGAIYLRHSTLNMYGGTITGNKAAWGGAVFIDGSDNNSTFNMHGGTISSNTAEKGGGGIEVENAKSSLNIYAGSIIDNSVENTDGGLRKGGGVHFANGTVNIYGTEGDVIIKNNTVASVENNVFLRFYDNVNTVITVPSPTNISSNSSIGVSSQNCNGKTVVKTYGDDNNRCFFLDGTNSSSYLLVYESGKVSIVNPSSHEHNWVQGEETAPTVDSVGKISSTCKSCGATKEDALYLSINDPKIIVEYVNTLTYNGQAQTQKLNVYYEDTLLSEGTHYTLSGNNKTNAGNYNLTITGKGSFEGNRTIGYVINKAPLTITVNNEEITYGDAVPTYSVIFSGFVNDETKNVLTGALAFNCAYAKYSNVGEYDITASGYESNNYNITYNKGNLTVIPKEVELVWGNTTLTYNGQVQQPSTSFTGLVNNDTCDIVVNGAQTNVGTYTAIVSGLTNANYKLASGVFSTDYTINPKSISGATIELDSALVYTGEELTQSVKTVVLDGITLSDSDFTVTANKGTNAGSYTLFVNGIGNYCGNETKVFEIAKANLTVTVNDKVVTYGDEVPTYTVTYTGFVNNETKDVLSGTLEFDCVYAQFSNVGNYDITASGYSSDNYQITYVKGNVEVTRKVVGLDWSNLLFTDNGDAHLPTVTITGLVNDDICSVEVTGEKSNAGVHIATATALSNNNYMLPETATVKFVIQKDSTPDKVTSDDKKVIDEALKIIEDLLSEENQGNLTEEEKATLADQKAALEEKRDNIKAAEEGMKDVNDTATSLPEANKVTSDNKESIEEALDVIEDLLSEEKAGNLTDAEKAKLADQKAALEEKLENIKAVEEKIEIVEDQATDIPKANEVTSENKTAIEEVLGKIKDLLSEENAGNLTEGEKATLVEQKTELEEKLGNIKTAEEGMKDVNETATSLPEADKVTSANKEEIDEALEIIETLLAPENVGNLTAEEKAAVEAQKSALTSKLNNIVAAEEGMKDVNETATSLPPANKVTSDNRESIEEALEAIDQLLAPEKAGNLTDAEKEKLADQKAALEEKLDNIKAVEEKMEIVEDQATDIPEANAVTSENKTEIEEVLGKIKELLSDEKSGNLTATEKEKLAYQKTALEEKLGNIKDAEEKMEAVKDTATSLPEAGKVTSDNKESIEEALDVIEDLLSEEKAGNLTDAEKLKLAEQKAALEEKRDNIKAAEEGMKDVNDTATSLPEANKVTSDNKESIEEALDVIEDLLSEEKAGNLTDAEKAKLADQKAALEEKLDNIKAAEEGMKAVEETVTSLPPASEVTSKYKEKIEETLEVIEGLLAEENAGNLTETEKTAVEAKKAALTAKLEKIEAVEEGMKAVEETATSLPPASEVTSKNKEAIEEALEIIDSLLAPENVGNLTEEQIEFIENLKEELQQKQDRIQEIEEALNKVEEESTAQPDYEDITSDNKEDIKDIITNIENILKDDQENLSTEEKEALEEQKKDLEDKVAFIEKIEKYEPVVDDFENTTEPEINDNNGNLANDSNELIEIIPLEKTEKEHVAKGESVKVYLEVTDITETVTEEDKELIEAELENEEVAVYLDLTLFKQIGNREPKKVPNTKGTVTITFQVPSELLNQDASVTRTYKIIRVHEGETTIIDAVFDEATGKITFETDKFSTYALIYDDVAVKAPQTGDTTATWPWMLLMLGFGMVVLAGKTSSMRELKKR